VRHPLALPPERLVTPCAKSEFAFETTAEVAPLEGVIGQERAVEAVRFGIGIRRAGYNIFAFGPPGTGKRTTIHHFLEREARDRPEPDDWCYVHNFVEPHRPRCVRLPPGWAHRVAQDVARVVSDLQVVLPQVFESDRYVAGRRNLGETFEERGEARMAEVAKLADANNLVLLRGEDGLSVAPRMPDGTVMSPAAFQSLPEPERAQLLERMEATETELENALRFVRGLKRDEQAAQDALRREAATQDIHDRLEALRAAFGRFPAVALWLDGVEADILENLDAFVRREGDDGDADPARDVPGARDEARLRRYKVNVMRDGSGQAGAPLVLETHPTLGNLVGRIEQEQRLGALVTDFMLIKPGALHRANGGYLVLTMQDLARHPFSWDALKRALRVAAIHIEQPADPGNIMTTITLDPEPIPLDLKVVVIGEPGVYFSLHALDDEFIKLFKVAAEFGSSMPRSPHGCHQYAGFISRVAVRDNTLPFDAGAVARIVEFGSRYVEDAERLTTDFLAIHSLIVEADYWARRAKRAVVGQADVESAIRESVRRADLSRERIYDEITRGTIRLDLEGVAIGQVNALTVLGRGDFEFGLPIRVTARVRQGGGDVVDIEREVELGGALHSKGVLILSGYLAGRYAVDEALSLHASLTFEQSYGPIDGDSASGAELAALLSAIAEAPLRQDVAITGSASQSGELQAIGGVNEKIEGYFDLCRARGLTGTQGVIIPAANVGDLMLREDVIASVAAGQFAVWSAAHIDEALALMAGVDAGERGADGQFPAASLNRRIEDRLRAFAASRRDHGDDDERDDGGSKRARPRRPA